MDRKEKVFTGLFWTYTERIFAQVVSLIVTVVLSRYIFPKEFAVISIVNIFISIANAFVVNGFGNSLIQKKDADDADYSTIFYFGIAFSLALYVLLWIIAPYIASFYDNRILIIVLRIMGVRLPLAAINSVQQAYIAKEMKFKKFFISTSIGTIVSAVVGIFMAISGFEVWALVAQYLINSFIDTVVLSITSGWKPKLFFSVKRLKPLFTYGWKIMFVGVMTQLYRNLRNILIGKVFTVEDLALSEKGEQFPSIIATNINTSMQKVLFPVYSEVQDNVSEMKNMVRKSITLGSYILVPILIGMATVSGDLVLVLLTEKWFDCVPFLSIMCVVYSLQPIQTASLQSIKALGESKLYLSIDIVKKIFGIFVLIISFTVYHDLKIVFLGALIVEIFSVLIMWPINKKLLQYRYREQLEDIAPIILLNVFMVVVVRIVNFICVSCNPTVRLCIAVCSGAFSYIVGSAISHNKEFNYLIGLLLNFIRKR